jgi:5-methylcytosine-specific restriction endonuclease McrA
MYNVNMQKQCKHCKKSFNLPHFNSKFCSHVCNRRFFTAKYRNRISCYNKIYYANNIEKYKELWKKYHDAHKEELSARSRQRYQLLKKNNPELLHRWSRKGGKRYRQTENGKLTKRLDFHRRRNKIKLLEPIDKNEWLEKLKSFGSKCVNCGSSEKITIDHIVPISKGGTNHINNLQPLCGYCNSSKGAKIKDEGKVRHSK